MDCLPIPPKMESSEAPACTPRHRTIAYFYDRGHIFHDLYLSTIVVYACVPPRPKTELAGSNATKTMAPKRLARSQIGKLALFESLYLSVTRH
jgi:hypothetical protein